MNYHRYIKSKIITQLDAIPSLVALFRLRQDKIVFTNGCFDILHVGHTYALNTASHHGDKFIVGLNSDASVKRLKGSNRPIISEEYRALLLASLLCVDYVISFEEDTPEKLIRMLKPDVLVKGADYLKEDIVGADFVESYGGKIVQHDIKEHFSTTYILDRFS